MSEYKDYVLCKHQSERVFLFEAPAWSRLKEGDKVVVDTQYGQNEATVVKIITLSEIADKEYIEIMVFLANATEPLRKVIGKVELKEFRYQ